jgi:antitoxin component of MazEF toxin-antitoxin module
MTKKLIQHGNSAALVIDKAILELLNVKIDTPLEITTDGKNIIISPQTEQNAESMILASLEKINLKHGKVLQKLSR